MTQNDDIQALLDFFDTLIPLTENEKDLVKEKFQPHSYRRREDVLQEGEICRYYHFVVKGCLRMYKTDNEGTIHIIKFAAENDWMTDIPSYYTLKPSSLHIDALEATEVLRIRRNDLLDMYMHAQRFDRIFRILTENDLAKLQQRHLESISATAEERYESFLNDYSNLTNRLSQVQIASFLGITPEFLSRMRNRQVRSSSENEKESPHGIS